MKAKKIAKLQKRCNKLFEQMSSECLYMNYVKIGLGSHHEHTLCKHPYWKKALLIAECRLKNCPLIKEEE